MIIDSHVHFWKYHPIKEAWITDEMETIQRDFLPTDIAPIFTNSNIEGCVAVQADQSDAETRFLLNLAAENSFIKGVVGWIDLTDTSIEDKLNGLKTEEKLKGFRHIAQGETQGFLLQSTVTESIAQIGKYGYTYDIVLYNDQLVDAIKLSEKLPDRPFILDHCGKPSLRSSDITQWKANLKILAENPNMYCKLSGLLTEGHWHNHNEALLFECFDAVLNSFNPKRILFGSDWPVVLLAGKYDQWLTLVKKYLNHFSAEEQSAILYKNASDFYKLSV